jgi:hypothetical protein
MTARSPCRYNPTGALTDRTNEHDVYIGQETEDHVADFALTVRASAYEWPAENMPRIVKVNSALLECLCTLARIPVEHSNAVEQLSRFVFGHRVRPR